MAIDHLVTTAVSGLGFFLLASSSSRLSVSLPVYSSRAEAYKTRTYRERFISTAGALSSQARLAVDPLVPSLSARTPPAAALRARATGSRPSSRRPGRGPPLLRARSALTSTIARPVSDPWRTIVLTLSTTEQM